MKGLKDNWTELVLCILAVYQWGVDGLLWWIALMSMGWAVRKIIIR